MIVGLVATGQLGLEGALPMIMGANIGTSVTSTIVALGYIGDRREYMRAIAVLYKNRKKIYNYIRSIRYLSLFLTSIVHLSQMGVKKSEHEDSCKSCKKSSNSSKIEKLKRIARKKKNFSTTTVPKTMNSKNS